MPAQIYLIPGFMGFHSLGSFSYFRRVPALLTELLAERGVTDAVIRECPTVPTGSIARRAQRALSFIAETGGHKAGSVHVIGHSTGGLDARLLAAPGVRLIPGTIEEEIGARIRSVITLSTPHYGTPLAEMLLALPFRRSLEYVGRVTTSSRGRQAVVAIARFLQGLARIDDWLGRTDTFLDSLADKVLRRIKHDLDDPMWGFLGEMSQDQGAVVQLTMASLHLFNAAVADRPGTRYSCVITAAPQPSYRFLPGEPRSLIQLASKIVFWTLYKIVSRASHQYPYTAMDVEQLNLSRFSQLIAITKHSNDGVVPCQSQAYGDILDVVLGDHLDVVGQFPNAGGDPHADWLPCGAGFDEERFRYVWSLIAQEIVAAEAQGRHPDGAVAVARKPARRPRAAPALTTAAAKRPPRTAGATERPAPARKRRQRANGAAAMSNT